MAASLRASSSSPQPPDNVDQEEENASPTSFKSPDTHHAQDEPIPEGEELATRAETSTENEDDEGPRTGQDGDVEPPAEAETETPDNEKGEGATPTQMEWQAVWSPPHNAYYFFNTRTQETTWVNPLQNPSAPADNENSADNTQQPSSTTTPGAGPSTTPQHNSAAAVGPSYGTTPQPDPASLNGIDPALAYLDPTLYVPQGAGAPGQSFTARFNARTGRFTAMDARDPSHLSEAQRAARMSEVYFDVGKWEQEVAARKASEQEAAEDVGEKRKRPSKKDLERFKEAKKQKKLAKTAWLRS